jgi:pimeloyl-ACP methyl ester carboxylesterase
VLHGLTAQREAVALDLPGFGDAPIQPPAGTPAGVGPLTGLVSGFLDELGLERPHVAGNSLGGWISLELGKARSRPLGNSGLTCGLLQSTPGSLRTSVVAVERPDRAATCAEGRPPSPLRSRVCWPSVSLSPTPHGSHRLTRRPRFAHSCSPPWFDETLPAAALDRFRDGEQISVPVTIAWGEKDRLLLPRQAHHAARLIPGARIVILRGCGHVPMYDDPDQVAQVLLDGSRD